MQLIVAFVICDTIATEVFFAAAEGQAWLGMKYRPMLARYIDYDLPEAPILQIS